MRFVRIQMVSLKEHTFLIYCTIIPRVVESQPLVQSLI